MDPTRSAPLEDNSNGGPIAGVEGMVYLTNQIGPGDGDVVVQRRLIPRLDQNDLIGETRTAPAR
jgi:hypothetical protein